MSHTYTSSLFHCTFSTKGRRQSITSALQERLWAYLGGIAREHQVKALAVGGTTDHVHLLLALPSSLAIAKVMQLVKGSSSRWIHETFPSQERFAWQEGYGAFSIGVSQTAWTIAYIDSQAEHHRKRSFQEEYLLFLQRHGIAYDEQ
jgi:REP element-mobilizing transposase RayT